MPLKLTNGSCLVLPESDSMDLLELCAEGGRAPDMRRAFAVAQKCADEDQEPYLIVRVERIVNPSGKRGEE